MRTDEAKPFETREVLPVFFICTGQEGWGYRKDIPYQKGWIYLVPKAHVRPKKKVGKDVFTTGLTG